MADKTETYQKEINLGMDQGEAAMIFAAKVDRILELLDKIYDRLETGVDVTDQH